MLRSLGTVTYHSLRVNRHFFWMVPASNATLFAIVGAVLALLIWRAPGTKLARLSTWLLLFLAAFSMAYKLPGLYLSAIVCIAIAATCIVFPWFEITTTWCAGSSGSLFPSASCCSFSLCSPGTGERHRESGTPWPALTRRRAGISQRLAGRSGHRPCRRASPYGSPRDTTPALAKWSRGRCALTTPIRPRPGHSLLMQACSQDDGFTNTRPMSPNLWTPPIPLWPRFSPGEAMPPRASSPTWRTATRGTVSPRLRPLRRLLREQQGESRGSPASLQPGRVRPDLEASGRPSSGWRALLGSTSTGRPPQWSIGMPWPGWATTRTVRSSCS